MKNTRLLEILRILRSNILSYYEMGKLEGFCYILADMTYHSNLSLDEHILTGCFLDSNRPTETGDTAWWWTHGELAPRLEFIDEMIAKIELEVNTINNLNTNKY